MNDRDDAELDELLKAFQGLSPTQTQKNSWKASIARNSRLSTGQLRQKGWKHLWIQYRSLGAALSVGIILGAILIQSWKQRQPPLFNESIGCSTTDLSKDYVFAKSE